MRHIDLQTMAIRNTVTPGIGCDQETTKVQHLKRRIPTKNSRTTMTQMRTTRTLSQGLHNEGWAQTIPRTSQELTTHEETYSLVDQTQDQGN